MNIVKVILVAGCSVIAPAVFLFIFGSLPQYWNYKISPLLMAVLLTLAPLMNIPVFIFLKRKFGIILSFSKKPLSVNIVILLSLLSIVIFFLIPLIVHPVSFFNSLHQGNINVVMPGIEKLNLSFIFFSIGKVFIAPFIEEIIFRGIIYQVLKRSYSVWVSLFLSSLLFSLVHFDFSTTGILFFIYGVLFCFVYEKTNTLLAPIFLHTSINFLSQTTTTFTINASTANILIYISIIITFIAITTFFIIKIKQSQEKRDSQTLQTN